MNRALQFINLIGILAVVGMCCVQWRTNRNLDLEVGRLERIRVEQTEKISQQETTIRQNAADLDELRHRLVLAEDQLKDEYEKLIAASSERDRLKASLDQFITAVTQRDAAIKQASEQIQKITNERDDAIVKFNDLAEKYNAIAKNK